MSHLVQGSHYRCAGVRTLNIASHSQWESLMCNNPQTMCHTVRTLYGMGYTCFRSRHRRPWNYPCKAILSNNEKWPCMVSVSFFPELHSTILPHLKFALNIYWDICGHSTINFRRTGPFLWWVVSKAFETYWWKPLFHNWFVEVWISLVPVFLTLKNSVTTCVPQHAATTRCNDKIFYFKNFSRRNLKFDSNFSSKNRDIISFSNWYKFFWSFHTGFYTDFSPIFSIYRSLRPNVSWVVYIHVTNCIKSLW